MKLRLAAVALIGAVLTLSALVTHSIELRRQALPAVQRSALVENAVDSLLPTINHERNQPYADVAAFLTANPRCCTVVDCGRTLSEWCRPSRPHYVVIVTYRDEFRLQHHSRVFDYEGRARGW